MKERVSLLRSKKSNWRGQLIFTVGMIIFFMSSLFFQSHKPNIISGAIFLVIGTIVTIFSFVQDNRSKYPWVDPSVTKNKQFMGAVMTMFLVMMVNVVSNILLPFYLQSFIGLSPLTSGLLMVLQSATMFFVTPLAGYLADKMNRHVLTIFGTTILTLSQLGYAFYPSGVNYTIIIIPIILNGIGMATFLSPNNALSMSYLPRELSGIAGSMNSFFRTLGMGIGISLGSTALFIQMPGVEVVSSKLGQEFMGAFQNVFFLATALSVLGMVVSIILYLTSKNETEPGH